MNSIKHTFVIALLALGPTAAYAGTVNNANMTTFSPGTPAVASEVNGNFTEQSTQINDNDGRIITNSDNITNNAASISDNTAGVADNAAAISGKQDTVVFGSDKISGQTIGSVSTFYQYGTNTITPSRSGTCLVTGVGHLNFDQTDTGTVRFRLAMQAGGVTNTVDSQFPSILSRTAIGTQTTRSRVAQFQVTAGETYKFGCYYGLIGSNYYDDSVACSVTYSCF